MKCMFTGQDTDSYEHVMPRWLQRRFHLEEQTVIIPNGSALPYKYVKVPVASEPNGRFGQIENRIAQGILDPSELYLWALKLHIGFIYRDSTLKYDRRKSEGPFVLSVNAFAQEIWLFQQLYENWANGGGTIPSPFGSVFVVDSLNPTPRFDFLHCLITGTVLIDIGGKLILVFLWDQGDGAKTNILEQWTSFHEPRVKAKAGDPSERANCYLAPHVWACEAAYFLYRNRRPYTMVKTTNQITLVPPLVRTPGKEPNEQEYRQICRNFALDLVQYNGETRNVYSNFDSGTLTTNNAGGL